jgi:hypothetical protein
VNLEHVLDLARRGELYPGVILHGATDEVRRAAAEKLARTLLCAAEPGARPCGVCNHCRRLRVEPTAEGKRSDERFHPDFAVLERDLKTSTSVDATKTLLRGAQVSPFEARGQVFVVAAAETLSGEGANALLKTLEEPHTSAPRHFLLLAPAREDLLPTVRSRCLSVYLGAAAELPEAEVAALAERFGGIVGEFARSRATVFLLAAATRLEAAGDFKDPRAGRGWALAARAIVQARAHHAPPELSRPLLALAEELLARGPELRLRGIGAARILDGLVAKHLARC